MGSAEYTKRLLTYRLTLLHLQEVGLSTVYSYLIAGETGYSAALVRKDLSKLKVRGKRRGGYEIETILEAISKHFGNRKDKKVILMGMGNIGEAIAHYKDFERHGIRIIAAFDINPDKQRKKSSVPVYPMDNCRELIKRENIDVAIIAVPAHSAQAVCDRLIQCGIRGIMNFAPTILRVPDHIYVSNVRLCDELKQVIYHASTK